VADGAEEFDGDGGGLLIGSFGIIITLLGLIHFVRLVLESWVSLTV